MRKISLLVASVVVVSFASLIIAPVHAKPVTEVKAFVVKPKSRSFFCTYDNVCAHRIENEDHKRLFASGWFPYDGPPDRRIASAAHRNLSFLDVARCDWMPNVLSPDEKELEIVWSIEYPKPFSAEEAPIFRFSLIPFKASYNICMPITRDQLDFTRMVEYTRTYMSQQYTLRFPASRLTIEPLFGYGSSILATFTSVYRRRVPNAAVVSAYQIVDYRYERSWRIAASNDTAIARFGNITNATGIDSRRNATIWNAIVPFDNSNSSNNNNNTKKYKFFQKYGYVTNRSTIASRLEAIPKVIALLLIVFAMGKIH